MEMIKICQHCGNVVTAEGRSKFCSAGCQVAFYGKIENKEYSRAYYEANKDKIKERAKAYSKAYHKRKRVEKPPMLEKLCLYCSKVFITNNKRMYCSKICGERYRNKVKRGSKIIPPDTNK